MVEVVEVLRDGALANLVVLSVMMIVYFYCSTTSCNFFTMVLADFEF